MPYWMTKLSSLEKGSRRLCRVEIGLDIKGQNLDILYQTYIKLCSGLTRVAFVVGIFSRQMIILKLESMGH